MKPREPSGRESPNEPAGRPNPLESASRPGRGRSHLAAARVLVAGLVALGGPVPMAACTSMSRSGGEPAPEARREVLLEARAAATRGLGATAIQAASTPTALGASDLPPRGAADSGFTLDLATALDLASRANRGIAIADASLDVAGADVDVARAALLPGASLRASWNWFSDPQTNSVDLDPSLLPPGTPTPLVTVRQDAFVNAGAVARLALDASGELRRALGASQAAWRAERARALATRLEEERSVVSAWLGLLEAGSLREVAAQSLALRQRQLLDATSREAGGRLTRNGVLVAEVAVIEARQRLLQQDNAVSSARRALNRVVGIEIDAPTRCSDVRGRPVPPPLDEAVAAAVERNPLLTAMVEEVNAAEARVGAARRSRLPRLAATAGYDATSADVLSPQDYASAQLALEWAIADPAREGRIAGLEDALRRTRLVLDRTAREVEALVRSTHDALAERLAAIDAASASVGQAEENLRIRRLQFDEGRATSEDVLDAADLLTRQRAALASSLYQAHARRAELQQLMGWPLRDLDLVAGASVPASSAGTGTETGTRDTKRTGGAPREDGPGGIER